MKADFDKSPVADVGGHGAETSASRFQPRIDLVDEDVALRITVELGSLTPQDVQTTIENGALVLRGKKKQEGQTRQSGCYQLERAYGDFMRSIPLPDKLYLDSIDTTFEAGVLTLSFRKIQAL